MIKTNSNNRKNGGIKMNTKKKTSKIPHIMMSWLIMLTLMIGLIPITNVQAAQTIEYRDPAEHWMSTSNRTSELDINANITYETQYCDDCAINTTHITYRVPEYTRSGETALNRGVKYSDGTMFDGVSKGNLDSGTPGVNAYYTGYHWTKSVCQNCGINGDIVYVLYDCASGFMVDFSESHIEQYNDNYHTEVKKSGNYCHFCHGTNKTITKTQKAHDYRNHVDPQIGNQRFVVSSDCGDCEHEKTQYKTAKSVVTSYYGKEDGKAHTINVVDLSDSGVNTSIRYGTSVGNCNLTSAPNYTEPGYYTVAYNITYSYSGESMSESGAAYIQILEDSSIKPNDNQSGGQNASSHEHDYRYLDTVQPTCNNLGYENWQCRTCGGLWKTNYKNATGHNHKTTTIREASCTTSGLKLHICVNCGDFYEETLPMTAHSYNSKVIAPTCTEVGYTEHTCGSCNQKYVTDIKPFSAHRYTAKYTPPTCTEKGFNTYTCLECDDSYISDYVNEKGHNWNNGETLTSSTCESDGVTVYTCNDCGETKMQAVSASGHHAGAEATCTEPQICLDCNSVLALPKGHNHKATITAPTCTKMGYTVYTCVDCNDSYIADYTEVIPHQYHKEVTAPTCTTMGYTEYTCVDCDDSYISDYTNVLPHNYKKDVTAPSCTAMGYTVYTCIDCGDSYKSDYTEILPHDYNEEVTAPTCTNMGYTAYTCNDCGETYTGNYTEEKPHNYKAAVTAPTCTEMGFTVFTCEDCGASYEGNYTEIISHNYETEVIAATCQTMGYTVYTCVDCNDSYTGDYTDVLPHRHDTEITASTCTSTGHTTYTCLDCGEAYIGDITEILEHDFDSVVTEPTCTTMGYTTYTCPDCNITYDTHYVEPLGHSPSEWIVDKAATILESGSRHKECTVCGEILHTAKIRQLNSHGITDEDGKTNVGNFIIIVTDSKREPVVNADVTIDIDDNVSVKLPDGRLLDYSDQTIITVLLTEDNSPVSDINIDAFDVKNNSATGKTDVEGEFIVPGENTSTGNNGNGTIGGEDEDEGEEANKFTYVVTVTDKDDNIVDNCIISLGQDNDIVVDLPEGVKMDRENPITVTVTDQNGEPQNAKNIIVMGDADYIEKGATDINGKLTVPPQNTGYTGDDGKVKVDGYIVKVEDTTEVIKGAFVTHTEEKKLTVMLPDGKILDSNNQTTVTVLLIDGKAVNNLNVTVSDNKNATATKTTDTNGKIIVPNKPSGGSGSGGGSGSSGGGGGGSSYVSSLNVTVFDKDDKKISYPTVSIDKDNNVSVKLPKAYDIADGNFVTVKVTDNRGAIKENIKVTVTDNGNRTATGYTDKNGAVILPGKLHTAYIEGYPGGYFKPDENMTRAEAAAIFARLLSAQRNEKIGGYSSFPDVSSKEWYNDYISYLKAYKIILGYTDGSFKPNNQITRAEFVTMAVRFYGVYNKEDVKTNSKNNPFKDVQNNYWAISDIYAAVSNGWILGYGDGTFKGDNDITRAEAVTTLNRLLERTPDKDYIDKNLSKLTQFKDINRHWAYYEILESANTHHTVQNADKEIWIKK